MEIESSFLALQVTTTFSLYFAPRQQLAHLVIHKKQYILHTCSLRGIFTSAFLALLLLLPPSKFLESTGEEHAAAHRVCTAVVVAHVGKMSYNANVPLK